ncbi:MAG: phosphopantothenoylcysteine decarboxylase [Leptospiraceae bacterium]|nr:phosphopantothenoylcysteine decarboxylase [Leptospiraceae bacterium]MCB1306380.1 phosphopantothenoylcysteine decarboxylase [Leptospiraceae bacterium]
MQARTIVIAVSGSIAAYKTCDLVRNLARKKIPVRVCMTRNATRFVGAVTFQALTGQSVIVDEWDQGMLHIDLKNEAALFAVVPATANIIGKMASGIADDAVTSTYLALQCPAFVAPAMNPNMYSHSAVQRNLQTLRSDGVSILDPAAGEVICGDVGQGKMEDIQIIEAKLLEKYNELIS